ncbi:thiolase-like protein, partial [Mycena pura]
MGAFLKNYDGLDTTALDMSAEDARAMPFAARRLLQLSFEALQDSGIDYRTRTVGCFMSGTSNFETATNWSTKFTIDQNTDGSFACLANRTSSMLDIKGPSMHGCSSSLTALHLAIQAIESGDCSAALVGAAQIDRGLGWKKYVLGGALSQDADGFARGEGAVVIVLKLLDDALRDNDHIYSVILGSAVNVNGPRAPSAVAQKDCIHMAYARAGRNVTDVDYAELHVTLTGTCVGDRIEANAAGEAFFRGTELVVGSVEGNIGHLEAAAFLASLLKACHILEKKTIPPSVNLRTEVDWDKYLLHVPTESAPLQSRSGQSIISISGADIGGSTGHVVIESPPPRERHWDTIEDSDNVTFVLGGLSPRAVADISQSVRDAKLPDVQSMRACAVTLGRRARQMPWRTSFTLPMSESSEATIPAATLVPASPPPLAWIFSGQGPQHLEMGRGLFALSPVFRRTILELDDVYRRKIGVSLVETTGLFAHRTCDPPLTLQPTGWPVTITVAALAMLQMALFDLLSSVGVTPSSLVGHSSGEIAILYASGAGSKALALEIAIAHGQAIAPTEGAEVGMASLACSADVAARIVSQISEGDHCSLEISCFNSPDSVALSGSSTLLDAAIRAAHNEGILAQRIRTMVPGHSSFMDGIKDDYLSRMSDIFRRYPGPHIPRVPVFSTCTGQVRVAEFTPAYFWDNCRKPVLFSPAISRLLNFHASATGSSSDDHIGFLEISCHAVLASFVLCHGVPEQSIICPMSRSSST